MVKYFEGYMNTTHYNFIPILIIILVRNNIIITIIRLLITNTAVELL